MDANPFVTLTSDIKEPSTVPDISDLLVLVQVLVEEHLDLLLVDIAHLLWGYGDHIAILVASFGGKLVDICNVGEPIVEDSQLGEILLGNLATGVVEFALVNALAKVSGVALRERGRVPYIVVIVPVCSHFGS